MKNCYRLFVGLLMFTVSLCCAHGQENNTSNPEITPIITDRPDVTESSATVAPGFIQIETGGFYTSFEDHNIKTESFTYNTTLFRIGLLNNLELRLGWDFVEERTTMNGNRSEDISSGFTPLLFGTKVAISEERGVFPKMALISQVRLPFAAGTDFKPETTGVDLIFAFSHTLNSQSGLSYNLGAKWGNDSPEAAFVYSFSYGYSISDKIGAYAEIYGDLPENSKANHLWDAGVTYLISNNVQLDATVGSSITSGQDILLSAGISFRLPTKQKN